MRIRAAVLAFGLVAGAMTAQAQSTGFLFAGGGLSNPTGKSGDALESGMWMTVGGGWNIKSVKGLGFGAEYQLSSMDWKVGSGSTSSSAIFGNLGYTFNPDDKLNWGAGVGIGSMSSKPKGGKSSSDMAWQLWFGPGWTLSPEWLFWGSVNYISAGDGATKMTMMPISLGLTWSIGAPSK
jgi:hypothetical protein